MTELTNELAKLKAEEAAKAAKAKAKREAKAAEAKAKREAENRKKTTAELSFELDEEIDKLFLEDSPIKLQDRMMHLREVAKRKGLNIRETEIKRKIWEGRRRSQGEPEMLEPGMAIATSI